MPTFWKGHIMPQDEAEALSGQKIPDAIFGVHPTGNIIHVLVEEFPKEWKGIVLPDYARGMGEQMGIGYIIAAGPRAGHSDHAVNTGGAIGIIGGHENPSDLLGLHVIFASHVGMPLRVSVFDREFRAAVLVMTSKDIRGVDTNPVPLTKRVEEGR